MAKKKNVSRAKKSKKVVRKAKTGARRVKKVKKPASKKTRPAPKKEAVDPNMEKIGEVTHYFPHVNAAAVKILKNSLHVGDQVYLKGHTTDFKEDVTSIQLDHAMIQEGKKGQEIGLLVKERVRIGDTVYRVKR